jgi:hypothetical protein
VIAVRLHQARGDAGLTCSWLYCCVKTQDAGAGDDLVLGLMWQLMVPPGM